MYCRGLCVGAQGVARQGCRAAEPRRNGAATPRSRRAGGIPASRAAERAAMRARRQAPSGRRRASREHGWSPAGRGQEQRHAPCARPRSRWSVPRTRSVGRDADAGHGCPACAVRSTGRAVHSGWHGESRVPAWVGGASPRAGAPRGASRSDERPERAARGRAASATGQAPRATRRATRKTPRAPQPADPPPICVFLWSPTGRPRGAGRPRMRAGGGYLNKRPGCGLVRRPSLRPPRPRCFPPPGRSVGRTLRPGGVSLQRPEGPDGVRGARPR